MHLTITVSQWQGLPQLSFDADQPITVTVVHKDEHQADVLTVLPGTVATVWPVFPMERKIERPTGP